MLKRWTRASPARVPVAEDVVRLAYRTVLRREADTKGLALYAGALRDGKDLPWLLDTLASSGEGQALDGLLLAATQPGPPPQPAHELGLRSPMVVDARCSAQELQALWDHVAQTWSRLGEDEPHWSVMTNDLYRAANLDQEQLATFFETGDHEVHRLNMRLARAGIAIRPGMVCAEYGCGVGRITHALARQYDRVAGFDVSAPHLRAAEAWLASRGIGNVELVRVTGKQSLEAIQGIDVFFSIIALQHSPPPIILDVLERAFAALRPGGYAYFQVPTFATDYRYAVAEHLAAIRAEGASDEMEVHFVPQHVVFRLAHDAGLRVLEVQPDLCTGSLDRWISNTFLLQRPA